MIRCLWVLVLMLAGVSMAEAGPLQVKSESLTVDHAKNRAQFFGAVHLTRDDFELRCDRLVAFYKNRAGGELERAEAYGHVSMLQGKKHGSSNKAEYHQIKGILILIGDAKVADPEGTIRGEKIIHNIQTTETKVQQGVAGERVHLTFEAEEDNTGSPGEGKLP